MKKQALALDSKAATFLVNQEKEYKMNSSQNNQLTLKFWGYLFEMLYSNLNISQCFIHTSKLFFHPWGPGASCSKGQ